MILVITMNARRKPTVFNRGTNPRKFKQGVVGRRNGEVKLIEAFPPNFFVMLEEKRVSHNVSVLAYHIVWIPEYRRRIPVGPVAAALRELIEAKASEMGWRIAALEVMPDHIRLFYSG